jgi:hypothetical protein
MSAPQREISAAFEYWPHRLQGWHTSRTMSPG